MVGVKGDPTAIMSATTTTLRRLMQLTGFSQRQVLLGFAGVVLKTWAGRTKVAREPEVDRRARKNAIRKLGYTKATGRGEVTVNAGWKPAPYGRVWLQVRNPASSKNSYILAKGQNFTDPTGKSTFSMYKRKLHGTSGKWYAEINEAVRSAPAAVDRAQKLARPSVGLARQSVVQIADSLGIDLNRVEGGGTLSAQGIKKATDSLASNGKRYRNGIGTQGGDGVYDWVSLMNYIPYGTKIGMDRTLLGVLAGQNKYFEKSYAKGAFNSQKKACAAYPNIFRFSAAA